MQDKPTLKARELADELVGLGILRFCEKEDRSVSPRRSPPPFPAGDLREAIPTREVSMCGAEHRRSLRREGSGRQRR